jgi:hypothetical protein
MTARVNEFRKLNVIINNNIQIFREKSKKKVKNCHFFGKNGDFPIHPTDLSVSRFWILLLA